MIAQDRQGLGSGRVVVGVDDSQEAVNALAWAVDKTELLGPVTAVVAYHVPSALRSVLTGSGLKPERLHREAAETRLSDAMAAVDLDPTDGVSGRVVEARPGPGLCEAAAEADLLVVGTRGHRGVVASVLGSVSSHCVRHATVPVVVVPPEHPPVGPLARVVVGMDGSESARQALRWALEHTDPDGLVLAIGAMPMWGYAIDDKAPPPEEIDQVILQMVERSVTEVMADRHTGPDVEIVVDRRDARVALRDPPGPPADLLVVGARGLSELPFLLLGSVSSALAHHPRIPTVIVRTDQTATQEVEAQ